MHKIIFLSIGMIFFISNTLCAQKLKVGTEYDQILVDYFLKTVLKKGNLRGDCVCSEVLHKNHPIVFLDSVWEGNLFLSTHIVYAILDFGGSNKTIADIDRILNLQWLNNLYENTEEATPYNRRLEARLPKYKKKKQKPNGKPYYNIQLEEVFGLDEHIYGVFYVQEIRSNRSCTTIFVIIQLDVEGTILDATSSTLCD
jgi:hypothetical protein